MTHDLLVQLCATLFAAIAQLSGYPRPADVPQIHQVPHAEVEHIACRGQCAARAVFVPGEGVFIDDDLDLVNDPYARSILVHELVHYLQGAAGRFDDLAPCLAWNAREREAYMIQNAYLEMSQTGMHVGNSRIASCRS